MLIMMPRKAVVPVDEGKVTFSKDLNEYEKDLPFMKESEEVLSNIPDTWKKYPNTMKGRCDIIDMEYGELKNAITPEEKQHELVHLASACLHLYRFIRDGK